MIVFAHRIFPPQTLCTRGNKLRIVMEKTAFNMKTIYASKLDLNWRNKLIRCCTRSIAMYSAESWTMGRVDQK